jgi:tRNA-specific 2-thiouridylase
MKKINKKVIVAMSGGVDSAVAAALLKEKYQTVVGVFLYFWKDADSLAPFENMAMIDARRVCQKLGIRFYTINFFDKFKDKIVDYFLAEYREGRTPNPCVKCNKLIKLGELIQRSREMGFDYVATGHYVRLKTKEGVYELRKAKDKDKDQTYFLSDLGQTELQHLLFPLGEYKKDRVRAIARKRNLQVFAKKDSNEICFVPNGKHNDFLKKYLTLKSGNIFDLSGKKIGEHQGLPLYTIGQRKGIEIGGTGPYYAVRMDFSQNILFVSNDKNDKELCKREFFMGKINWSASPKFKQKNKQGEEIFLSCEVVIRYRHQPIKCKIFRPFPKRTQGNIDYQYKIILATPQRAITPGQQAVFYNGAKMLGGGEIL